MKRTLVFFDKNGKKSTLERDMSFNIATELKHAKGMISKYFGLELTLIEQVRLKEYVVQSIRDAELNIGMTAVFAEASARFMCFEYGLPFEYATVDPLIEDEASLRQKNPEEFKEYMRILQERMHLP